MAQAVYLQTYGCQMNERDSEEILGMLTGQGYAIDRVRFTTSHPFDAHEELFRAMAECRSVCEFLHLPVQSGADRMLRAMRRGCTVETYLGQIARLRALVPHVALSTDIIVGFPGETEADLPHGEVRRVRLTYDSVPEHPIAP